MISRVFYKRLLAYILMFTTVTFFGGPSVAMTKIPLATSAKVEAFTTRRDQCDHFRGEEPYNAARAREIAAKVKRYCTGTDRELRRLRKKYAGNPRVLRTLNRYDPAVE